LVTKHRAKSLRLWACLRWSGGHVLCQDGYNRIHCGVEVTEFSTNKQHTLSIELISWIVPVWSGVPFASYSHNKGRARQRRSEGPRAETIHTLLKRGAFPLPPTSQSSALASLLPVGSGSKGIRTCCFWGSSRARPAFSAAVRRKHKPVSRR
jgi:hypothetical protein